MKRPELPAGNGGDIPGFSRIEKRRGSRCILKFLNPCDLMIIEVNHLAGWIAIYMRKRAGTFEERFLKELKRQCDGQDVAVLNRTLREQLGWQDETFDKVRNGLLKKKVIKAGQGHGGKTKFANFEQNSIKKAALKVFISYCHADEILKDKLIQHLRPLERLGLISSWHDRLIRAGENFSNTIDKELEAASIVLLLVSIDFINSKYCYETELARALERQEAGSCKVIPIILRNCLWTHSPFGGILALPVDGIPVASWPNLDDAFKSVAEAIREVAVEFLEG